MKKIMVLIWLLLAVLLTSCAAVPAEEVPEAKELPKVSAAVQPPPTAEGPVEYRVQTQVWQDTASTEDGVELASYRLQLPVLSAYLSNGTELLEAKTDKQEQALAAVETFNEKFEKWAAAEEFPIIVSNAEEDLIWRQTEGLEPFYPYTIGLDCEIYQTNAMVSVDGLYYSYSGGAHPNTYLLGWNFDLGTGAFFDPAQLGEEGFVQTVTEELIRQARVWAAEEADMLLEDLYWEDYQATISNWSSYAVSFDESGMTVGFSAYELAPYAAGPQIFTVSYDWLLPHLSEHGRMLLGLEA